MGAKYFIFKVGAKNDVEVRTYKGITETDIEYIKYNNFLKREYFVDVYENDDFIPMILKDEVLMILREEQFEVTQMEDIFDILYDKLYDRGETLEKSIDY